MRQTLAAVADDLRVQGVGWRQKPDATPGFAGDPARHGSSSMMITIAILPRSWKFPSLAKEGWRAAPVWFASLIPRLIQDRYIGAGRLVILVQKLMG